MSLADLVCIESVSEVLNNAENVEHRGFMGESL